MKLKNVFSSIGLIFSIYSIVGYILTSVAAKLVIFLVPREMLNINMVLLPTFLIQYAIIFPLTILLFKKVPSAILPRKIMQKKDFFQLLFMLYPCITLGTFISWLLTTSISKITNKPVPNAINEILMNANPFLIILFVCIIGPLTEEYLTRKFLIDRTIQYGQGLSIVLSATIFALLHGNFYQSFYTWILGAVFAYVYIKTGEIKYSTFMHIIINSASVLLLFLIRGSALSLIDKDNMSMQEIMEFADNLQLEPLNIICMFGIFLYMLIYFGFIICGIVFIIKNIKKMHLNNFGILSKNTRKEKFKIIYLNLGMIIFMLISLYNFIDSIFVFGK